MAVDNLVLVHDANNVAARDGLPLAHIGRMEGPAHVAGEAGDVHALGHVDVAGVLKDMLQGPLDAVEDGAHDAGAQLHGQRLLLAQHGVAHRQPRRVLVHLDGRRVALQLDDLAHQLRVAHAHQLVHGGAAHAVGHHEGPGDGEDESVVAFYFRHGADDDGFGVVVEAVEAAVVSIYWVDQCFICAVVLLS